MLVRPLIVVALLSLLTSLAPAAAGTWTPIPTPNAARILQVGYLLGPDQPLYAVGESQLYLSRDGGETWDGRTGIAVGNAFAFDPNSLVIYAGDGTTGLVKRSTDAGLSWSGGVFAGWEGGSIEALACDPAKPNRLWLGKSQGGLFFSDDSGSSWRPTDLNGIAEKPFFVQTIFVHSIPGSLLVGTRGRGLFRSTDDGMSWSQPPGIPPKGTVLSLASAPTEPMTIYCGTAGGGVFKSTDAGLSWDAVQPQLANVRVNTLCIDTTDSRLLYAAVSGSIHGGVYRSTDGAASWDRLVSQAGSDEAFSVAIDPGDADVLYAGAIGVEKSTDAGETWVSRTLGIHGADLWGFRVVGSQALFAWTYDALFKATESGSWTRIAGNFVRNFMVGFHPGPELLVATADGTVLTSADEGQTWLEHATGLQNLSCLAADPHSPGVFYVAGLGVARSTDGGKTWSPLASPDDFGIKRLVVDPHIPSRLYAVSAREFATGFRTTDGGASWSPCSPYETVDIEVDPFTANRLYAIHRTEGPYVSTDDGVTWQKSTGGTQSGFHGSKHVVVDPNQPGRICVLGIYLFLSGDGGASWERIDSQELRSVEPWQRPQFGSGPAQLFLGGSRGIFVRPLEDPGSAAGAAALSALEGVQTPGVTLAPNGVYSPAASRETARSSRRQNVTPSGAAIVSVVESPVDSNRLAAVSSLGRLYLSEDAGASWKPAAMTHVASVAFHPTNADTLYAGGGFLAMTSDFGKTWSNPGGGALAFKTVQFDPRDPENIWAFGDEVWRSTDAGKTWAAVMTFNPALPARGYLPEAEPGAIYRLGTDGVKKSTDDGRRWSPFGVCEASQYLVHPASPDIHYLASTIYGLLGSTDGGRTWAALNQGRPEIGASSVVSSSGDPEVLFIAAPGSPAGCFASTDGGRSWNARPSDSSHVYSLALSPLTGALYAGTREGVRVSLDSGDQWAPISAGITEVLSWGLVAAPVRDGALFLGSHRGLLRSKDAGATWVPLNSGPQPVADLMHVIADGDLAIHPVDPRLIYLLGENGTEIRRSDDGGDTWGLVWEADGQTNFRTIAVDPVNTEIVYAGSGEGGLTFVRSTDRGRTWVNQEINRSLGRLQTGNRPGSLYAVAEVLRLSADYGRTWNTLGCPVQAFKLAIDPRDDRYLFAVSRTEVYLSTDGGTTWTRSMSGLPTNRRGEQWGPAWIFDIKIDPENQSRVVLARDDGVFLSSDRGLSWSFVQTGLDPGQVQVAFVHASGAPWLVTLSNSEDVFHQYSYWASIDRFPLVRPRRYPR